MGQVLHGSATTTHAVRAAIQRSKASIQALSERYGINPKTVAKWRTRTSLEDCPMGPKVPRSTVLSADEETLIIGFRRRTLLPSMMPLRAAGDDSPPDAVLATSASAAPRDLLQADLDNEAETIRNYRERVKAGSRECFR